MKLDRYQRCIHRKIDPRSPFLCSQHERRNLSFKLTFSLRSCVLDDELMCRVLLYSPSFIIPVQYIFAFHMRYQHNTVSASKLDYNLFHFDGIFIGDKLAFVCKWYNGISRKHSKHPYKFKATIEMQITNSCRKHWRMKKLMSVCGQPRIRSLRIFYDKNFKQFAIFSPSNWHPLIIIVLFRILFTSIVLQNYFSFYCKEFYKIFVHLFKL